MIKIDVTPVDCMQTAKVTRDEEFMDRKPDRLNPFKTDRIAFNIYDFEAWQAMLMRRHPHSDSVLMVVEGEGTMFIDDDNFGISPGEAVYVPAGACYGILAGENDMVIIASQGPTPVDTGTGKGLSYRCPDCDLETPVSLGTAGNGETVCPRCEARLRLTQTADGFTASEARPPAFTGAGQAAAGMEQPGAGVEAPSGEDTEGFEIEIEGVAVMP
jgi:mannose-6-phosphate isomerase-like protein (cupin superfamily)